MLPSGKRYALGLMAPITLIHRLASMNVSTPTCSKELAAKARDVRTRELIGCAGVSSEGGAYDAFEGRLSRYGPSFKRLYLTNFLHFALQLEECDIFLKDYPEVVKCIPRLNLRIYTLWKENDRAMTGFLRADLVKIADGFDEMRSKYNTRDVDANADFRAWVDQKVEANDELVEKLQSIQRWANSNYDKSRIEFIRSRRERSDFFAAKALLMEPPLEVHDLFRLSSFRNAIAYRGSLSDKAWESLEKRIRLELTEVERDMSGLLVRCRRRSFSLDSESDEIHTAEGQIHADPQTDQEDCIDSSAIPHVTNGPGAFDGRVATTVDGLTDSGFAQNVLSVAHLLQGSTLEDKYKTQIALAYGVQKHKALVGCSPNQAMFEKLRLALLRNGILGLFEGFRCRACHKLNQKAPAYGHFGRSIKSLAKLGDHYFSKHCPLDWSKDMLDLPSPQELLAQLKMPGQQKAYSTFKQLFPLECDIDLDPQLRDDATEASEVETEGTANNNSLADEQVRSIVEDSPDETDYRAATAYGSNKHNILQTKDPSEDHGFEESENSEEETEDTEYDGDADEEEEEEEEENEREVKGKGKEREKGKGKETQPKKSVQKEKVDERHLPGERILPRRRRNRRSNQSEANRETRKGFRPILPKNSIVLLAGECHFTPRIGGGADWHLVDSPGDTSEREI